MAVDVCDPSEEHSQTVEDPQEAGELVCRQPFPSIPLGFYGEGGDEKFKASHFSRFGPRVWHQGDFMRIEKDTQGILMLGRS
jgi:acetoacetyl-CoA synthetase